MRPPRCCCCCTCSSASEQGVDPARAARHDPERRAQGVRGARQLHLPAAAVDAATVDVFRTAASTFPRFNAISISGYHIREAGSSAAQELAFTLANGIAYVEAAVAAGLDVDALAPRLSFFFNAHNDVFVEVAKFRAARRLWARTMRERFGAQRRALADAALPRADGGSTLTAQQPLNNVVRVALQAFSATAGGCQSLHTNCFDEALALPTEQSATLALRTQQILAAESGVAARPTRSAARTTSRS